MLLSFTAKKACSHTCNAKLLDNTRAVWLNRVEPEREPGDTGCTNRTWIYTREELNLDRWASSVESYLSPTVKPETEFHFPGTSLFRNLKKKQFVGIEIRKENGLCLCLEWTYWVVVRELLWLKKKRAREKGKWVIIISSNGGYGGVCGGEGGVVRTCWWWECVG